MAVTPPTPQTAAQQKNQLQSMLSRGGQAYDPDAVYTNSTAANGLYENPRCKMPPDTYNLIGIVVGDRDEFRTIQDFIRNAVHHTLHRYIDGDPAISQEIRDILDAEDWVAELDKERRRTEAEEDKLDGIRLAMNEAVDLKDWKKLQFLWEHADEMSERDDLPEGRRQKYAEAAATLHTAMVYMKKEQTRYEKMAGSVTPMKRRAQ